MKRQLVSVLGSTGSIGENTLDVIGRNQERFGVAALTARRKVDRLAEQCAQFDVTLAVIAEPSLEGELAAALSARGARAAVMSGEAGLMAAAGLSECDIVMAAIVGAAGLQSTFHAACCGKKILLANKESLVIAGEVFVAEARRNGARIVPVDSEHNAIFQSLPLGFEVGCERGLEAAGVEKIILTASGGPFLDTPVAQLAQVTPEQACRHPNWTMGRKISVDSATLMNKGLEVVEARWLFNARPDQIEVLIHPQSIVHSMVAYRDGSVLAQLGTPDMRTPIAHALAHPARAAAGVAPLDLVARGRLDFAATDLRRFPCLALAYQALRAGAAAPAVLNAANEVAVAEFLARRLRFDGIAPLIEDALARFAGAAAGSLDALLALDGEVRDHALRASRALARTEGAA
jgi:1-deoxy-D-xylulose-5-phosphate reductoisomerase